LRILELTTNISIGSVARIVKDMYSIIENSGNECVIAYGRGECSNQYKSIKIGNKLDTYCHALMSRLTDRTGFYSKLVTKKFLKKVDNFRPDIIHIHCLHGYYINIPLLVEYINRNKIPVIWTFHDCWAFTGHCAYFDSCGCDKWKKKCYECEQLKSYPSSYFMDNSTDNYQRKKKLFTSINNLKIVTPSEWLERVIKESFLSVVPVQTINNGIDIEIFKFTNSNLREKYQLNNKKIVLGVASDWTERKGLNDFCEISDRLGDDYQVILVGITEEKLGDYKKNIISINRTSNVRELAEWYSVADVFVNPTIEDNYPSVNLEAIACGTPVVTYDTGGCAECLKFGHGKLIKKGNVEDMVSAIKDICRNEKNDTLSKSNISKEYCFNQYINLFNEVVNNE